MKSFSENYIKQFDNCKEVPVHFRPLLLSTLRRNCKKTFDKYGLQLGTVLRRPIDGLIAYHVANNSTSFAGKNPFITHGFGFLFCFNLPSIIDISTYSWVSKPLVLFL
jgi:hypothetical protein